MTVSDPERQEGEITRPFRKAIQIGEEHLDEYL
jgi:hypothetical protein